MRLPRDWLGPREDLIPFGAGADRAAAAMPADDEQDPRRRRARFATPPRRLLGRALPGASPRSPGSDVTDRSRGLCRRSGAAYGRAAERSAGGSRTAPSVAGRVCRCDCHGGAAGVIDADDVVRAHTEDQAGFCAVASARERGVGLPAGSQRRTSTARSRAGGQFTAIGDLTSPRRRRGPGEPRAGSHARKRSASTRAPHRHAHLRRHLSRTPRRRRPVRAPPRRRPRAPPAAERRQPASLKPAPPVDQLHPVRLPVRLDRQVHLAPCNHRMDKGALMTRLLAHARRNAVAYVALFVALGGTSYAAFSLPAGSVGAREIKNRR